MFRRIVTIACVLMLSLLVNAWGDGDGGGQPLNRAEVTQVKRMLEDLVKALGAPPAGYDQLEQDFNLPTTYQSHKEAGRFRPLNAGVRMRFGSDSRKVEKANEQAAQEWQKKYMEATAKGDTAAMNKMMQEYQQMIANLQLQAMKAQTEQKVPVTVDIRINDYASAAIDPDSVVLEKPGVIALLDKGSDDSRVVCYFEPQALKQTETLSQISFEYPQNGVAGKTSVSNVVIEMQGPENEIREWAKKIDTAAVLAKIK